MKTNQQRAIDPERQYRKAAKKAERILKKEFDTTARKLAAPAYPNTPYGVRTLRFVYDVLKEREAQW